MPGSTGRRGRALRSYCWVSVPAENSSPEAVQLLFKAGLGPYVRTKPLHASQRLLQETAETLAVSLHVLPTPELETLLLIFGADVEVLAPITLRMRLAKRLKTAVQQYL